MKNTKFEGDGKYGSEYYYSPAQDMQQKIMGLLDDCKKYTQEGDGDKLWKTVCMLSVYLERFMPEPLIRDFVEAKQMLKIKEMELQKSIKDPSKLDREKDKLRFNLGEKAHEACIRVFVNSPLISKKVVSVLDAEDLKDVDGYAPLMSRIRDYDNKINIFPEEVEASV